MPSLLAKHLFSPIGLSLPSRKQNSQPSAHIALTVGASRPEVHSQYGMPSLLAKHLFSPIGLPLPSRKQNPQPSAHIDLTVGASRPEVRSQYGMPSLLAKHLFSLHRTSPPEQKAKSPAVCPYSSHRRCAPTGGPRKTLCVRILTGDLRRDMTQPFFQYKWEYGTMDIVRKNLSHVSLFVKILRC